MTKRRHPKHLNWEKAMQEIEFEEGRKESAKRKAREDKLDAAKEEQIRENRKNERTVVWQGGAPQ